MAQVCGMGTSSYALLCPHCVRKLRVDGSASGCEVRCSVCGGTFAGPPLAASERLDSLPRVKSRCPCGKAVPARSRKDDLRVLCSRCRAWMVVLRDTSPTAEFAPPTPTPPPATVAAAPLPPLPYAATDGGDDIERARHVLAGLLPSEPPTLPGMDVAAFSQFRHEVGGDYFDFVPLADGRMAIAIADVAGDGVGAALLMVRLREIVHSVLAQCTDAVEAVAAVNARLMENTPRGMLITFLLAVLNTTTRELRAVNAGHCAPFVWRARLTGVRLLPVRGPALGLLPAVPFAQAISERLLAIEPGDCLCLFTDGMSEANSPSGEEFGETRLAAALRRHVDRSAKEIADGIVAAVAAHTLSAAQHDDMTLIVLKAL